MPRFAKGRRPRGPPMSVDEYIGDRPTSVDAFIGSPPSEDEVDAPIGGDNFSEFLSYLGHRPGDAEANSRVDAKDEQPLERPHWGCPSCSFPNDSLYAVCESCGVERTACMAGGDETAMSGATNEMASGEDGSAIEDGVGVEDKADGSDDSAGESEDEEFGRRFIGDVLFPMFDSRGRFLRYGAREDSDHDERHVSRECIVSSGRQHKYEIAFAALLFVVALASIVFATGGGGSESRASLSEPTYQMAITTADDAELSSKQHAHPQMNHPHARNEPSPTVVPTRAPSSRKHTHPHKDHKWRHTNAPTRRHHTHAKKDHPPRGPDTSPSTTLDDQMEPNVSETTIRVETDTEPVREEPDPV